MTKPEPAGQAVSSPFCRSSPFLTLFGNLEKCGVIQPKTYLLTGWFILFRKTGWIVPFKFLWLSIDYQGDQLTETWQRFWIKRQKSHPKCLSMAGKRAPTLGVNRAVSLCMRLLLHGGHCCKWKRKRKTNPVTVEEGGITQDYGTQSL